MVRVGAKYAVAIAGEEEAPHCGAFFVARVKREALPPLAGGRCPESLPPRRRGADGGMSSAVTAGACRTRSFFAAALAPSSEENTSELQSNMRTSYAGCDYKKQI